jgi:hypothetical protein
MNAIFQSSSYFPQPTFTLSPRNVSDLQAQAMASLPHVPQQHITNHSEQQRLPSNVNKPMNEPASRNHFDRYLNDSDVETDQLPTNTNSHYKPAQSFKPLVQYSRHDLSTSAPKGTPIKTRSTSSREPKVSPSALKNHKSVDQLSIKEITEINNKLDRRVRFDESMNRQQTISRNSTSTYKQN